MGQDGAQSWPIDSIGLRRQAPLANAVPRGVNHPPPAPEIKKFCQSRAEFPVQWKIHP
jgi:hypothetical protein